MTQGETAGARVAQCRDAAPTPAWRALPQRLHVLGFSARKRRYLRLYLPTAQLCFVTRGRQVPEGACLVLWGSAVVPADCPQTHRIVRIEDGFLRSVGLGADLIFPVSWVIDGSGIYYDATRPSDLERILQETVFSDVLVQRAARLRDAVVAHQVTKYNVGSGQWQRPSGRYVVLVPGQVESDASIRFGAPGVRDNLGLLKAVRAARPDAYLVYKPHPDVQAGLRAPGQDEQQAQRWCDEIVVGVSMAQLLQSVDEVQVLTSATGFEALLRGVPVTCHGSPFYAGWGLTSDLHPLPRRMRRLSLDQLVAAALILYPTYVSRQQQCLSTPEAVLQELLDWRTSAAAEVAARPSWRRRCKRTLLRWVVGVK